MKVRFVFGPITSSSPARFSRGFPIRFTPVEEREGREPICQAPDKTCSVVASSMYV